MALNLEDDYGEYQIQASNVRKSGPQKDKRFCLLLY